MSFKARNFREWCNHTIPVLPQVYGDELSYYELLNKVVEKLNAVGITVNELIDYVNTYFDSKDWQQMVNNKLDGMVADGTLDNIINQKLFGELSGNVNMLLGNRKNFRNCKILCIGDSFGRGVYDGSEHLESSWPTKLGEYANGSIIYNYCQNNAGFLTDDNMFLNQLTKAKNDGHSDSHIIIIEGGHNDGYVDTTNLFSTIVDCVSYAKQNFPNAVIYVVAANTGTDSQITRSKRHSVWEIMQSASNLTGVTFWMANMYVWNIDATLSNDGIHLNQFGYQMLASVIYQLLCGADPQINADRKLGFETEWAGDKITMKNTSNFFETVTLPNNFYLNGDTPAITRDINLPNNYADRESPVAISIPMGVNGEDINGWMVLRLRNGRLEMCPLAYKGAGGYVVLSGSHEFFMPQFTATFPTLLIM